MKVVKLIVLVLLLVGIFGLIGISSQLSAMGEVTNFYRRLLTENQWFLPLIQGVIISVLILLAVGFLWTIMRPIHDKNQTIQKESGRVTIPKRTLEAIAKTAIQPLIEGQNVTINVQLTKKNLALVEVVLEETQAGAYVAKGTAIQAQIQQAFAQMVQLSTKQVDVTIEKGRKNQGVLPFSKKEPRVV